MSHYEKAWQAVAERIERAVQAAGRTAGSVRLLAVSKTFPVDAVRAVHAAGQRSFGENHVQEGAAKRQATSDLADVVWHLIGPLQGNKTPGGRNLRLGGKRGPPEDRAAGCRHSARRTARRSTCVQVNVSGEASKSGVAPHEVLALALAIADLPRIRVRGIMGILAPRTIGATAASNFAACGNASKVASRRDCHWTRFRWACRRISKPRSPKDRRRCAWAPSFLERGERVEASNRR
jgi:uncharacterized pyridoxal phosphate-containing UPF0001 family protein